LVDTQNEIDDALLVAHCLYIVLLVVCSL